MSQHYEVIVLGLGAMGSATTYQLAKRGSKVLGIDQFSPPHSYGSSHGDTRITRQAIGEGEHYVPIVLRSYEIWEEIQKEVQKQLLFKVGGLIMMPPESPSTHHGSADFLETTIHAAEKYGIQHEVLDTADIQKRFSQFHVQENEKGYYEKNAGYLIPELCIESQLSLAKKYGAEIHTNEKVLSWNVLGSGQVEVVTDHETYTADKLILTAGPWISKLLGKEYSHLFKIHRQVLYWFEIDEKDHALFSPPQMPIFIWEFGSGNISGEAMYGFPAINGPKGGVKVASEQFMETTDVENMKREVSQEEMEYMYDHYLRDRIPGLKPNCLKATSCLYTVTPDSAFIIDTHPQHEQVIIASPCSGHGFKHSAAIGEILAEVATIGKSTIDISAFKINRF